ncbi:AAA family ATPase [Paraliobacillus ryukyuensis]|uniref:AAA family ATPase n=1 Tax=Paraliobacillus ryukyuensis TaxID=200904 RepID=UPI0009A8A4D9|nr:AAA family ATPase [Paraliobacillus ryukyuensis]
MGFRSSVKKNIPKVDLQDYNVLVAGDYKSGKTRLWKEVMELFFPDDPDAATLFAFEEGYNTWELESVVDMHNKGWEFFRSEVVPDLVQEAKDGRITKVIGVDTVDKLIDSASEWLIKKWNKKYGVQYESIQEHNENINTENVWIALKDEIWTQIDKLKNAGYGFFWLAWTKVKETTTIDGLKYNSVELMMNTTGQKIFKSQADLICCLYGDVVVTDKDGNELDENLKTKKNKEVASNFHETEINMYFRPSNFIEIAGGRFTNLPDKETYSAENFLRVFEEAVKGQLKKTKQSVEDIKKDQAKKREDNTKEFAEQEESKLSSGELVEQIDNEIIRLKKIKKQKELVKEFNKLFGSAMGYKESVDENNLAKALEFAKSIK